MNNDLISREALKKAFKAWKTMDDYYHDTDCNDIPLSEAFDLIDNAPTADDWQKYSDELWLWKNAYEKGKAARQPGEWIPITEKLPNTLGVYNVTRKLKEGETIYFISAASYFDGQNTWHDDTRVNHGRPYLTDVIAWMPKPEPYKKGGWIC